MAILFGAAYFYTTCRISASSQSWAAKSIPAAITRTNPQKQAKFRNHLILLARNDVGYHNLVKLVSHGFLEGFLLQARVDKAQIARYAEGLICLSACISGEIPKAILREDMKAARELALEYAKIFPGRFIWNCRKTACPNRKRPTRA